MTKEAPATTDGQWEYTATCSSLAWKTPGDVSKPEIDWSKPLPIEPAFYTKTCACQSCMSRDIISATSQIFQKRDFPPYDSLRALDFTTNFQDQTKIDMK